MDVTNSSVLLKKIKSSVDSSGKFDKESLIQLLNEFPERWLSDLLLGGVIPEPRKDETSDIIQALLNVLQEILNNPADDARLSIENKLELFRFTASLLGLSIFYKEVEQNLKAGSDSFSSVSRMMLRLGAWLESQHYNGIDHTKKRFKKQNIIDPTSILQADIHSDSPGAPGQSLGGVLEEQMECADLIIRYMLHAFLPSNGFGTYADAKTPYEDPELEKIIDLSNRWRLLDVTWASIKYLSWKPVSIKGTTCYVPHHKDDYERSEIGKIRKNMINQQNGFRIMQLGSLFNKKEHAALDLLKSSIKVPSACALWDGQLDLDALKKLAQSSTHIFLNDVSIVEKLYSSLLAKIHIPIPGGVKLSWEKWITAKGSLIALAQALQEAVKSQVSEPGGNGCMQTVFCVKKERIAELICGVTDYEQSESLSLVDIFIFNQKRKKLEIWDQPLLPLNNEDVLLVPSLILAGEPTRHLENFIDEWGGSYDSRGSEFEIHIEEKLKKEGLLVTRSLKFFTSESRDVEFDLFGYWQNTIILLEAKCLKSVHAPADEHRARGKIGEAIEQLVRRRRIVKSDWTSIKGLLPDWNLPTDPPPEGDIICIAVSNITSFTGLIEEGCYVTDTSSFFRFFGKSNVEQQVLGKEGLSVRATGWNLRSGPVSPHQLRIYLGNPPQVSQVKKFLQHEWLPIPKISEKTPQIALMTSTFQGSARDLANTKAAHGSPKKKLDTKAQKKLKRKEAKSQRRKNRK